MCITPVFHTNFLIYRNAGGIDMRQKRIAIIIIFSVALILLATTAILLACFFSDGIHTLFSFVHVDFSETVYVVSEDHSILSTGILTAKGSAAPSPKNGVSAGKNAFEHIEISGFPSITGDDYAAAYTMEQNNGIIVLTVSKPGAQKDGKDNDETMDIEAKYTIFIDKSTSKMLLCQLQVREDNTQKTYYAITSKDVSIITETLNKAYSN